MNKSTLEKVFFLFQLPCVYENHKVDSKSIVDYKNLSELLERCICYYENIYFNDVVCLNYKRLFNNYVKRSSCRLYFFTTIDITQYIPTKTANLII